MVRGATPQPFAVEILGVLDDGIGAGRDMIIIEASDLPGRNVISAGGGIWAGMSGSPVYINGKLLGAVSYGFSASPVADRRGHPRGRHARPARPAEPTAARKATAAKAAPDRVSLSAAERKAIAARATAAVPAGLTGGAADADVAERPVGGAGGPLPGRGRRRRAVRDRVRGEQGGGSGARPR